MKYKVIITVARGTTSSLHKFSIVKKHNNYQLFKESSYLFIGIEIFLMKLVKNMSKIQYNLCRH